MFHIADIDDNLSTPILKRSDFEDFLKNRPTRPCRVVEVNEDGIWRSSEILPEGNLPAWCALVDFVKSRKTMFLYGDCWHFALALNRLYGLQPAFIRIPGKHVPEGETGIEHVVGLLPDGRLVDVLGIHEDLESFRLRFNQILSLPYSGRKPIENIVLEATDIESVEAALKFYHFYNEDVGASIATGPTPKWNDPKAYPFAAEAEMYVDLLLGTYIEFALSKPAERMRI